MIAIQNYIAGKDALINDTEARPAKHFDLKKGAALVTWSIDDGKFGERFFTGILKEALTNQWHRSSGELLRFIQTCSGKLLGNHLSCSKLRSMNCLTGASQPSSKMHSPSIEVVSGKTRDRGRWKGPRIPGRTAPESYTEAVESLRKLQQQVATKAAPLTILRLSEVSQKS